MIQDHGESQMSLGNETLDYYARNADSFVSGTISADMAETRSRFTAHLPASALILDFGCGSGRDSKAFLDAGFRVEATDGSEELCAKAAAYTGMAVSLWVFWAWARIAKQRTALCI